MIKIINTCPPRLEMAIRLQAKIPGSILNCDDFTDPGRFTSTAYFNYQRGWSLAGEDSCVQMDEDIVLCRDFNEQLAAVIARYPDTLIQFFSMRGDDLTVGTRYIPGSKFMMQQCYYLPPGMASAILSESKGFYLTTTHLHCPTDIVIACYLKRMGLSYLNYCPNLVDHLCTKSMIDKRRSSHRQSKTFNLRLAWTDGET